MKIARERPFHIQSKVCVVLRPEFDQGGLRTGSENEERGQRGEWRKFRL